MFAAFKSEALASPAVLDHATAWYAERVQQLVENPNRFRDAPIKVEHSYDLRSFNFELAVMPGVHSFANFMQSKGASQADVLQALGWWAQQEGRGWPSIKR